MTGDEVKAWRQRQGLTQTALAAALGQTAQTVARWESGATAPSAFLWRALRDLARERAAMDAERMRSDDAVLGLAERMPARLPE